MTPRSPKAHPFLTGCAFAATIGTMILILFIIGGMIFLIARDGFRVDIEPIFSHITSYPLVVQLEVFNIIGVVVVFFVYMSNTTMDFGLELFYNLSLRLGAQAKPEDLARPPKSSSSHWIYILTGIHLALSIGIVLFFFGPPKNG